VDTSDTPSSGGGAILVAAALTVTLLAACGGSDDDDATTATTVPAPISCTSDAEITFLTDLSSCEEAFGRGGEFATELGLATGPNTPAAEAAVAMTCRQIQGTQAVTLPSPEIATLAEQLSSSGVCIGDLTLLVPTTTTPAVVLVESTGWTLVDVVDGDTLDVVSPEGAQLRVQLIGINAPEPGACMSEQATNALRFMAGGKELKLVPDTSDTDAEGQKLRYVEQLDGVDLGATMIDLGLAVAEPVEPDIARGGRYAQQMLDAQAAAAGMWAPGACPPATTVPATTAPPTTTA
jgi:endonuclease YncB( thermonuclease family)